jgi:hypothetical protein
VTGARLKAGKAGKRKIVNEEWGVTYLEETASEVHQHRSWAFPHTTDTLPPKTLPPKTLTPSHRRGRVLDKLCVGIKERKRSVAGKMKEELENMTMRNGLGHTWKELKKRICLSPHRITDDRPGPQW